jgi:hypothetical protein
LFFSFHGFQFVDGQQYLTNLISLGLSLVLLNVDARIARPGSLEDGMTGSALAILRRLTVSLV